MNNKLNVLIILAALFLTSCLEDNLVPVVEFQLDETAKLLRLIEGNGDFVNSYEAPALITAAELYGNLSTIAVLDIRDDDDYLKGHIQNALRIEPMDLFRTVDSINASDPSKKIVIVSRNGQASAYFTCLLRLAEFNNVYSLSYGMASWHNDFASEWFDVLGNAPDLPSYNNYEYSLNPYTGLPLLQFPEELKSTEEKLLYRIKIVINSGFDLHCSSELMDMMIQRSHYIICYGKPQLYGAPKEFGFTGHPPGAVWYLGPYRFDFRSMNNLQRLPTDKPILIYSGDGQESACITAYLRVLGYNAKTFLFGANRLFYLRMLGTPELNEFLFSVADVMNYPYLSGN